MFFLCCSQLTWYIAVQSLPLFSTLTCIISYTSASIGTRSNTHFHTYMCIYEHFTFLYIDVNLLPCSHLSPLHPGGHVQSPKSSQDPPFRHCVSKLVLVDCVLCDIVSYLEGMWRWVVERDNNKWTVEDSRSHCHTETRCTGLI